MIRHAGLIARWQAGVWRAVLIEGDSGVGKSDLMLRALESGWSLVADDRVALWTSGGALYGRAPQSLAGLMEIRGLDVARLPRRDFAAVALAVRCLASAGPERLPEPRALPVLGLAIPAIELIAREASAPAKLAYALSHLGLRPQPAYQTRRTGSIGRLREGSRGSH